MINIKNVFDFDHLYFSMKDISMDIAKQHDLLRLIIQKMEIKTEADDVDEFGANDDELALRQTTDKAKVGWWSPAIRKTLMQQTAVISKLKKNVME